MLIKPYFFDSTKGRVNLMQMLNNNQNFCVKKYCKTGIDFLFFLTVAFNCNFLLLHPNRELNFYFRITNYQQQHEFLMKLKPYEAIKTEVSMKYTQEDIQLLMKKNSIKIIK